MRFLCDRRESVRDFRKVAANFGRVQGECVSEPRTDSLAEKGGRGGPKDAKFDPSSGRLELGGGVRPRRYG